MPRFNVSTDLLNNYLRLINWMKKTDLLLLKMAGQITSIDIQNF